MLAFLTTLALAGAPEPEPGLLAIDARLPAEVLVDGRPIAEIYVASRVEIEVPAGPHALKIYTNGTPEQLDVVVPSGEALRVVVGRTGLSVSAERPEPAGTAPVAVQFRMTDPTGARVYLDERRLRLPSGGQLDLDLDPGDHRLALRSEDGTVVWASGTLFVEGPDPLVIQVSEGRMPEIVGQGAFASGT